MNVFLLLAVFFLGNFFTIFISAKLMLSLEKVLDEEIDTGYELLKVIGYTFTAVFSLITFWIIIKEAYHVLFFMGVGVALVMMLWELFFSSDIPKLIRKKISNKNKIYNQPQVILSPKRVSPKDDVQDPKYGLVIDKPIFTSDMKGLERYLSMLHILSEDTSLDEKKLSWKVSGSYRSDKFNGMIYKYDGYLNSDTLYSALYLCPYGTQNSICAPRGFFLSADVGSELEKEIATEYGMSLEDYRQFMSVAKENARLQMEIDKHLNDADEVKNNTIESLETTRKYMRFGMSCFASIQLPGDWYFTQTSTTTYAAMKNQTNGFTFEFILHQSIINLGLTIDHFLTDTTSDLLKQGFEISQHFATINKTSRLFHLIEDETIKKILLVETKNGILIVKATFSDFSDNLTEYDIEDILKTLSVDDPKDEKGCVNEVLHNFPPFPMMPSKGRMN